MHVITTKEHSDETLWKPKRRESWSALGEVQHLEVSRWPEFCVSVLVTQSCPTLCDPVDCSPPVPLSMDSPGKNTGVGCHFLLQGIFHTQGSNPSLLHYRQILYDLSHQGSLSTRTPPGKPRILPYSKCTWSSMSAFLTPPFERFRRAELYLEGNGINQWKDFCIWWR